MVGRWGLTACGGVGVGVGVCVGGVGGLTCLVQVVGKVGGGGWLTRLRCKGSSSSSSKVASVRASALLMSSAAYPTRAHLHPLCSLLQTDPYLPHPPSLRSPGPHGLPAPVVARRPGPLADAAAGRAAGRCLQAQRQPGRAAAGGRAAPGAGPAGAGGALPDHDHPGHAGARRPGHRCSQRPAHLARNPARAGRVPGLRSPCSSGPGCPGGGWVGEGRSVHLAARRRTRASATHTHTHAHAHTSESRRGWRRRC
jgi:hypothetical protein